MSEQGKRERERAARLAAEFQAIKDPAARLRAAEKAGFKIANKPPEWPYWNRKPVTTSHEAICLTLNYDPRAFVKELCDKSRYRDLYEFVSSYISDGSLRYLNPVAKTFRVVDWLRWLERIEVPVPIEWQPIGFERKLIEVQLEKGGPCWEEAVSAAIEMRDSPKFNTPRTHQQLYEYMLENRKRFPQCCPASVQNEESVKQRVYRERQRGQVKNPLKEPRFLGAS